MLSESKKIKEEIEYFKRERNDWSLDSGMYNAKEKIQELDNKIKELEDKLYEVEFQELMNEENNKHNDIQG